MADLQHKHAQELRDMWQGRVLAHTIGNPLGVVVLSVLAHSYDDAVQTLLHVVAPGVRIGADLPYLRTAGKIAKTGHVIADLTTTAGKIRRRVKIFRDTGEMQSTFRRLADELKLSDDDRRELFGAAQRWIVCDFRLDPTMNPGDPEAKRLVVH